MRGRGISFYGPGKIQVRQGDTDLNPKLCWPYIVQWVVDTMSILPAARSESAEKTNTTVKHNCFFFCTLSLT